MLYSRLKEKQQAMIKLVEYISEIKRLIEIFVEERDQFFEEELDKVYSEALKDLGEMNLEADSKDEAEQHEPEVPTSSLLGRFLGPKLYIKVWIFPPEHKPYELDYMLDLGCEINLAKDNAIP